MSVKGFKLINGEELIARVDEVMSSKDKYVIERPRILVPQQVGDRLQLNLYPWVWGGGKDVTCDLGSHAISAVFDVVPELEKEYVADTTGIQLVTG